MPPLQPSAGRGAGALQPRARAWSAAGRRRGESRERRARRSGSRLSWVGGQAQLRVSLLPSSPIGVQGLGPGDPWAPPGRASRDAGPSIPAPGSLRSIPLLGVLGQPALPWKLLCPVWPLECAPECACRGGGRGMTACRRQPVAGRALQGRTRWGSPPGPGVNWPVFRHRNGAGSCFSLRLQNRSPGGLGGAVRCASRSATGR